MIVNVQEFGHSVAYNTTIENISRTRHVYICKHDFRQHKSPNAYAAISQSLQQLSIGPQLVVVVCKQVHLSSPLRPSVKLESLVRILGVAPYVHQSNAGIASTTSLENYS